MNSELTVAESFDSLGHFISHCISIFLTSNSCECPHRLLDLIVKERRHSAFTVSVGSHYRANVRPDKENFVIQICSLK